MIINEYEAVALTYCSHLKDLPLAPELIRTTGAYKVCDTQKNHPARLSSTPVDENSRLCFEIIFK